VCSFILCSWQETVDGKTQKKRENGKKDTKDLRQRRKVIGQY